MILDTFLQGRVPSRAAGIARSPALPASGVAVLLRLLRAIGAAGGPKGGPQSHQDRKGWVRTRFHNRLPVKGLKSIPKGSLPCVDPDIGEERDFTGVWGEAAMNVSAPAHASKSRPAQRRAATNGERDSQSRARRCATRQPVLRSLVRNEAVCPIACSNVRWDSCN